MDAIFGSVIGVALISGAIWFARTGIARWLTKDIEHRYETKLEQLRSEMRIREESIRASLQSKEEQIVSLRNTALARLTAKGSALDQRRLVAIDQLWEGVHSLAEFKNASSFMRAIKFEAALQAAAEDPATRKVFDVMSKMVNLDNVKTNLAYRARPFVTTSAWAAYAAYSSIGYCAAIQMNALKSGLDKNLVDEKHVRELVAAALPHQIALLDRFGFGAVHNLMDELEGVLLREIAKMLSFANETPEDLEHAAKTIHQSNVLMNSFAEPLAAAAAKP